MATRLITNSFRIEQDSPEASVYASKGNIVDGNTADRTTFRKDGSATAPTGGTVVADSGTLAAGSYRVCADLAFLGAKASNKALIVQRRDATNTTTLETLGTVAARNSSGSPGEAAVGPVTVSLATNERIRVITDSTAAGAGETAEAVIVGLRQFV